MQIRLRQVALVAADLSDVEADIGERLGLRPCYRDPGVARFGLHNVLFPVGEQLLEVVSPTEPDTTAGRLLDKRGGDGGYMVILQVDDLGPHRRRFDRTGARVVFEGAVEGITGLHLHPRDVGGAILSVDRADDWDSWPWAGADWRRYVCTDVVQGMGRSSRWTRARSGSSRPSTDAARESADWNWPPPETPASSWAASGSRWSPSTPGNADPQTSGPTGLARPCRRDSIPSKVPAGPCGPSRLPWTPTAPPVDWLHPAVGPA